MLRLTGGHQPLHPLPRNRRKLIQRLVFLSSVQFGGIRRLQPAHSVLSLFLICSDNLFCICCARTSVHLLLLYISKVSECRSDCASVNVNVPTHTDVALPKRLVFFEQELNRGLQWFVLSGYNNSGAFVLLLSPLIVAFVR